MKRFILIFIVISSIVSFLHAQLVPKIEFSMAFPYQGFQSTPREYFLTTQYSAGVSLNINSFSDFVTTIAYTRQNPLFIQQRYNRISPQLDSRISYVPFTTDPYYSEYGIFFGARLISPKKSARVFLSGQLGMTGRKYGRIEYIPYQDPYGMPHAGDRYNEIEGAVVKLQIAGMYGAGIIFHPTNVLSLIFNLRAIDRFTKQSVDVYQNIGIQFGL